MLKCNNKLIAYSEASHLPGPVRARPYAYMEDMVRHGLYTELLTLRGPRNAAEAMTVIPAQKIAILTKLDPATGLMKQEPYDEPAPKPAYGPEPAPGLTCEPDTDHRTEPESEDPPESNTRSESEPRPDTERCPEPESEGPPESNPWSEPEPGPNTDRCPETEPEGPTDSEYVRDPHEKTAGYEPDEPETTQIEQGSSRDPPHAISARSGDPRQTDPRLPDILTAGASAAAVLAENIANAMALRQNAEAKLKHCDQILLDLLHVSEFYELDRQQSYRLQKIMHEARIERRQAKDEIIYLDHLTAYAMSPSSAPLAHLAELPEQLLNRKYSLRALSAEELERLLNGRPYKRHKKPEHT